MSKKSVTKDGKTRTVPAVGNGFQQVNTDFAVANVQKKMGEKTFKKRMARFANSKAVLLLAVLMTVSAVLSVFRPYLFSIKIFLISERTLMALLLWLLYATGGKYGMGLFSWLCVLETLVSTLAMAFCTAFIGCSMFAMQLLFTDKDDIVRLINGAEMWAVIPALLCLCVAYCIFLFKRHERLICCNLRDSLRFGFAFDKGSYVYMRNCMIVAIAMPVLYIIRGSLGDFSGIKAIPEGARNFYNYAFPMGDSYWLNLAGVLVHSAVLVVAGLICVRYAAMAKKFNQQREARLAEEEAVRAGIEELKAMEAEKLSERQEEKTAAMAEDGTLEGTEVYLKPQTTEESTEEEVAVAEKTVSMPAQQQDLGKTEVYLNSQTVGEEAPTAPVTDTLASIDEESHEAEASPEAPDEAEETELKSEDEGVKPL